MKMLKKILFAALATFPVACSTQTGDDAATGDEAEVNGATSYTLSKDFQEKLSGTAKTAFLKTCEANAKAKLVLAPKERKYSVAPTSSFGHCEHSAADL